MIQTENFRIKLWLVLATLAVAFAWTWQSSLRWQQFQYTTFDLAFYVQALDSFSRGENWSSLLGVKPFGNHADFIILLIWPLYAIFQHPMVLVAVQNLALAACLPLGWQIARIHGWNNGLSLLLAATLLLNPVLTYVALHEFHPEAFAAPFWLAIYLTWKQKRLGWFWAILVLFLSCKENLGLMIGAWCFIKLFDRKDRCPMLPWMILPGLFTALWMAAYLFWLGPLWNAGNVDFGALYSHLREMGPVAGTIHILGQSWRGAILWAILLPFLFLPLLRPWLLLPAVPILLQHLLSWRSSEWTIFYHYAAPILPVFWIATVEVVSAWKNRKWGFLPASFCAVANAICFVWMGTGAYYLQPFFHDDPHLAQKKEVVERIPADASVVAPLPYLSHLADRRELVSLHLVLKGLKTLSREEYTPPEPPDFLVIDYADTVTLDASSGYYHPKMVMKNGVTIASSDVLLHRLLARAKWNVESTGSITHFRKLDEEYTATPLVTTGEAPIRSAVIDPQTDLLTIHAEGEGEELTILGKWIVRGEREVVPWMTLLAKNRNTGETIQADRGLVVPEALPNGQVWMDRWRPGLKELTPKADWELFVVFENHALANYRRAFQLPSESPLERVTVPVLYRD